MSQVLTTIGGKLRIDKSGGRELVVSESGSSDDKPCCCCPKPPTNFCFTITDTKFTLSVSGTYYAMFKNGGTLTTPGSSREADGFPICFKQQYYIFGQVKAGSTFDDFGKIEALSFDNHRPCFDSGGNRIGGERITTVEADSEFFELTPVAFSEESEYCYIPITYEATSSNCGPPSGVRVTICLKFEAK